MFIDQMRKNSMGNLLQFDISSNLAKNNINNGYNIILGSEQNN